MAGILQTSRTSKENSNILKEIELHSIGYNSCNNGIPHNPIDFHSNEHFSQSN